MKKVYVILNKENNRVKIGISDNVKRRLATLKHESGSNLSIYYSTCFVNNAREIETEAHRYFKKYRYFGEWFDIDPEKAKLYLKSLLLIHNIDEYAEERITINKVSQKPKPQEIIDYEEHVLLDPLTRFTKVGKNIYFRKITKEYFYIKYKNKQWIIRKLRKSELGNLE